MIGDKKSTSTTRHIFHAQQRFHELKHKLDIPVKFVHLIRNPFDNIATMTLRAGHPTLRKKAEENNLQV